MISSRQLTGILLIAAAVVFNRYSLGWLISADRSIDSALLGLLILLFEAGLAVAGIAWLLIPDRLPTGMAKGAATLGAAALTLIGLAGLTGQLLWPHPDYKQATETDFSCNDGDRFCNEIYGSGVEFEKRFGKGAAAVDVDNDGIDDLFVSDADSRILDDYGVSALYLGNGDGTFKKTDVGIAEDDLISNWVASFADYDNDGDQDVIFGNGGYSGQSDLQFYENRLNDEGRFVRRTEAAGFAIHNDEPYSWWGASWADYNKDSYLDLALSRVDAPPVLFRNNGDGTFTDVTTQVGIDLVIGRWHDGKNPVWFDIDNDGDDDLYFAGIHAHGLYLNENGARFRNITDETFKPFPTNVVYSVRDAPVVFAAATLDFNQDGLDDLYFGRQTEQDHLLINNGDGSFSQLGAEIGIDAIITHKEDETQAFENTMGLGIGDLDDDGFPDIFIGSGDPVRADEDILYCNVGGETVRRCTEWIHRESDGLWFTRAHGTVFGDFNRDGHSDIFENLGGSPPWDLRNPDYNSRETAALFINQADEPRRTVTVHLTGTISNRDAIGARLKVSGDRDRYYTLRSTQAFQSLNSRYLLLSLGDSPNGVVEVTWPSGSVSTHKVEVGGNYEFLEPEVRPFVSPLIEP